MLQDPPESSEQILRRALKLLSDRLPAEWALNPIENEATGGFAQGPDMVAQLTAPDGQTNLLIFEAKRIVERRDLARIQSTLQGPIDGLVGRITGVLAARYLSPQVQTELNERELSYIDATGNMRISLSSPALYVGDRGADSDPWRGAGRPRGTLKGEPAARVVRTLVDYAREWRIKDLVTKAGSSVGATYRVIDYLETEGLLAKREGSGGIAVNDWPKILREWSSDYDVIAANRVGQYIEPRGLNAFFARAAETTTIAYAVTGSVAAAEWAPYAPARSAFVYVSNTEAAEKKWNLRPTDAGANILLIEPKSPKDIVFANTSRRADGLVLASAAQVAVDLMNGPGRNPAEAEELLTWMTANEAKWRK